MSDLWTEASRDIEADDAAVVMIQAKMAAASVWPFLAQAKSEREFEHRLALAEDRIDLVVPDPVARDHVVAAFREDYKLYTTADATWDDFHKTDPERTENKVNRFLDGAAQIGGFGDWDHMRMSDQNDTSMALRDQYHGGSGTHGFDQDDDPYYKITHPSGWYIKDHGGPNLVIGHEGTGDYDAHDAVDISDRQGNKPQGFGEPHLHQVLNDWVGEHGDDYASSIPQVKRWQQRRGSVEPLRIFHEASGQWITLQSAAQPTPGNAWDQEAPEEGPITGQTGTYPAEVAPDPHNPLNDQYPMQPTQWTEDTLWVERPMSFAPYRQAAAYQNEGVQTGPGPNPDYFSGGGEGVAGDQQAGFPVDTTLPEPDTWVDFYGSTPPVQSGGSTGGDVPYSNQQGRTAEKDNHGACYDCNQPVYRKGRDWFHLSSGGDDHPVRLPSNHPWVSARMSARKRANKYIKQDGDDWVITQKGTGKVLSRHDSEEKAEASFRAMMQSKHGSAGTFFDPTDRSVSMVRTAEVSSSDMGPSSAGDASGSSGAGTAPDPPPSMISGGPGAQAMPPMTIPNDSVSSNPFAGGGGAGMSQPASPAGPAGPAQPAQPMQPMARFVPRTAETRNRPTSQDPTGVGGDEFDANTWDNVLKQNPRQAPEERNVNTPQRAEEPIPQNSSDGGRREDEEEEGERQR